MSRFDEWLDTWEPLELGLFIWMIAIPLGCALFLFVAGCVAVWNLFV